ncbi:hypothetical protein EVAR_85275_1 [Eumeta japonica]|uniref:Uncharacterized protein n=1 Tax=Eumeta variegata TaxID=151549 RepID=A0A4C1VA67_EUMVA|nr:hypothetical protein EVAR_85275_1 [Eumeta japonica]
MGNDFHLASRISVCPSQPQKNHQFAVGFLKKNRISDGSGRRLMQKAHLYCDGAASGFGKISRKHPPAATEILIFETCPHLDNVIDGAAATHAAVFKQTVL